MARRSSTGTSPTTSSWGLYYVSARDGFNCVWAQRTGQGGGPAGPAIPAIHLHWAEHPSVQWPGVTQRLAVTKDRLFLLLTDVSGDIWSVKLER